MPETNASRSQSIFSELREARCKRANLLRSRSASSLVSTRSGDEIRAFWETSLTKAGFDLHRLRTLAAQNRTETTDIAARHLAEATAQLSQIAPAVVRNVRTTIDQLAIFVPPPPVQRFLLDTASEVSSTPGLPLTSTHTERANNTAEFRLKTDQDTDPFGGVTEVVSFVFSWQNSTDRYVIVNVDGYLVLNGLLQAILWDSYGPGGEFVVLEVSAELNVFELWNEPPTSPLQQPGQSQLTSQLSLSHSQIVFSPGETVNQIVSRGCDLQYIQLVIPPNGTAMFEVACSLFYKNYSGLVNLVFEPPHGQLLCPGVLVTVLN